MAHGAQCLMRMTSGQPAMDRILIQSPPLHTIVFDKVNNGKKVYLYRVRYTGTFSNGYAEISAPNAVFDGTSTAAVVYVDSSSANDTAAGTGVQEVTILGIDENDALVKVAVETGGTTGQSSVTKFKRIFHAYASAWGANNDAEGDIYIQDDVGGTTKYLKIAATYQDSEGSALFFPADYNFAIVSQYLVMTTSANANAAILVKNAVVNTGTFGADPDLAYTEIRASISDGGVKLTCTCPSLTSDGAKLTFSETYKGNAENGLYDALIAVWED